METAASLDKRNAPFRLPSVTLLSLVIELLIIIIAGLILTQPLADLNPAKRLPGDEGEYQLASMATIYNSLSTRGYISTWQPWLEFGEPLLNNPYNFLFNPISSVPSLILGPNNGTKVSVILSVILAGLGGWALARMLGLRALGRVLLGLLLVGKGNMPGMLIPGYFQLSVAQAYFPWIFAGIIGILWYRRRRWPIALTAISIALMFWTGLFWFLLPILLVIGVFFVIHIVRFQSTVGGSGQRVNWQLQIDIFMVRRMVFAAVVTVALCAITMLPLWVYQKFLGQSMISADKQVDIGATLTTLFSSNPDPTGAIFGNGLVWNYYSYVLPLWFAIGLLALFVITRFNRRTGSTYSNLWRVLIASLIMFIFCVFWGAGQNPIIEWAYTVLPLFAQFRNVSRVLGIASFLLAIMAAISLDMVWKSLVSSDRWRIIPARLWQTAQRPLAVLLVIASGAAVFQLFSPVDSAVGYGLWPVDTVEDGCVHWLRTQHPNDPLAIWTVNRDVMTTYMNNDVRHVNIATDFYQVEGEPQEYGPVNLIKLSLPSYALVFQYSDRDWAASIGYAPMLGSPSPPNSPLPCVMINTNALSYMYVVSLDTLQQFVSTNKVDASLTTPISTFDRDMDRVAAIATSDPNQELILTVQEIDFPGWTAQMDGQPARVVSVGGEIGVLLPPDGKTHQVLFEYKPSLFYAGAGLTLASILFLILYLLRVDRFIPVSLQHATVARLSSALSFMLDPTLLESKDDPDFDPAEVTPKQLPPGDDLIVTTPDEEGAEPDNTPATTREITAPVVKSAEAEPPHTNGRRSKRNRQRN